MVSNLEQDRRRSNRQADTAGRASSGEKLILVLRIEPTSYMLSLVGALRNSWPSAIRVVFQGTDLSQDWGLSLDADDLHVLPARPLQALAALHRHLSDMRPALVDVGGWATMSNVAAIVMARAKGAKVVVDSDSWFGSSNLAVRALKRILLPSLFRFVTYFGPGGTRQAAYLRELGVPEHKIRPINMTVDVAGIRAFLARSGGDARNRFRQLHGLAEDQFVILCVGRVTQAKGVVDLVSAFERIMDAHPGARLVFVGDGPYRRELEERRPGAGRVIFAGRLSGEDLWSAYAGADVFAAPSWRDPWGLVVNEAMACNVPVIVSDAYGCVGDLVKDGLTGVVYRACDVDNLAGAIGRLAADPSLRVKLSEAAARLISSWTIEDEARKVCEIWRDAIESA